MSLAKPLIVSLLFNLLYIIKSNSTVEKQLHLTASGNEKQANNIENVAGWFNDKWLAERTGEQRGSPSRNKIPSARTSSCVISGMENEVRKVRHLDRCSLPFCHQKSGDKSAA
ncbi:hypothetical protein GWI33_020287 [Rhynchophorus ferrugineus]|uniref:Secreted protein n=1 Tax=Rhynchophorus ferrugineus TaxID=354439 RepID=A0A834HRV1_RHYFE|nr:hypothetical protein GWI33_020287 [Rhynchophorus ferrugineus]